MRDRGNQLLLGLAALSVLAACDNPAGPPDTPVSRPNFSHWGTGMGAEGRGTLGAGSPTPGSDLQEFDFHVSSGLNGGRLFYRDFMALRVDGSPAHISVDPLDSETTITSYQDWATICADSTRGATFGGTGRLDSGVLTSFTVTVCDNGAAENGMDFFHIVVPPEAYEYGAAVSSGDIDKSGMDVAGAGYGRIGNGDTTAGSDLKELSFEVPADLSGGRLFYRDFAALRVDGTPAHIEVDPADPETAITAYQDWAGSCADPTRGVTLEGTGRLDTGILTTFRVMACDNGPAESGADFFHISVPSHDYELGGVLSSGDIGKSGTSTVVLQEGFDGGSLADWALSPENQRYSITASPLRSGTGSLQAFYDTIPDGAYGMLTRLFRDGNGQIVGYDEVYVRFSVMFEEGFKNMGPDSSGMHFFALAGNRSGDSTSWFGSAGVKPNGSDYFYAGLDPQSVFASDVLRPFQFYTYYAGMLCPPTYPEEPCFGNIFSQTEPRTELVGGQWQEVVIHVKLNTPPESDGSQTLWINGVKKLEVQNMAWRTTADLVLNQINFVNYLDRAPQQQRVWVDDLIVWRP